MAESAQNERPDAAPGGRDDAPRPEQGKEPIDKTGAPGVVSDPAPSTSDAPRAKPAPEVTPRDVATDSDWPGAGRNRIQDRPSDDGRALEQSGRDALAKHAEAQIEAQIEVQGEARARIQANQDTDERDPSLPQGEPVGRAGPT